MYPRIQFGNFYIPTFSLCAVAGIAAFVILLLLKLRKFGNFADEAYYILPKIFISFGVGLAGAVLLDALFKIPENGGFKISGMTFYGGAVTGIAVLYALLKLFAKNTRFTAWEYLNMLTIPFILFHICGRIGCFFGGCCYGKVTDGIFGVYFPDNAGAGIFHHGLKVLPTQLFEASALALTAIILTRFKNRFAIYCFAYPVIRFLLEFLRGDDRGWFILGLSPAQFISAVLVTAATAAICIRAISLHLKKKQDSV